MSAADGMQAQIADADFAQLADADAGAAKGCDNRASSDVDAGSSATGRRRWYVTVALESPGSAAMWVARIPATQRSATFAGVDPGAGVTGAAVGIVAFTLLLARPVAIWIALAVTDVDTVTKGFMAWFGAKGAATMTFALFVLGQGIPEGNRIFDIAALTVFSSILLHGLTDTPGIEWLARRTNATARRAAQAASVGRPT